MPACSTCARVSVAAGGPLRRTCLMQISSTQSCGRRPHSRQLTCAAACAVRQDANTPAWPGRSGCQPAGSPAVGISLRGGGGAACLSCLGHRNQLDTGSDIVTCRNCTRSQSAGVRGGHPGRGRACLLWVDDHRSVARMHAIPAKRAAMPWVWTPPGRAVSLRPADCGTCPCC